MTWQPEKERETLLGLIQVIGFHASVRRLTDGDFKPLSDKVMAEEAQEKLDWISDQIDFLLEEYDHEEIFHFINEYGAWKNNKEEQQPTRDIGDKA